MNNASIDMLMPKATDVKSQAVGVKSSDKTVKGNDNTFNTELSKVKTQTKDTKIAKSIVKDNTKDLLVKKPLDIKKLEDMQDEQAICNTILTLIQDVLQIPVEDIEHILETMNIEPTDLLNQDTFKEFLTYAYPVFNENELLFNEHHLKDISKLFAKFEQIKELLSDRESNILIEKLVIQDEVIQTTVTKVDSEGQTTESSSEEQGALSAVGIQDAVGNELSNQQAVKTALTTTTGETTLESNLSEEGFLSSQQMGLGLTTPIQAFNTIVHTKSWGMQNETANNSMSRLIQDQSLTNQLINKIDMINLVNHKEITMELSPKELGNLSIKLAETNGVIVANIRVDNEKTKELLLSEMAQLKQTLEAQGLSVSDVQVDVRQNQHQAEMEKQKQKSAKRIQELIDNHFTETEEASMQLDENTGELIETEVNYMV